METLSDRLKKAREDKGWSQTELARRSGVKQSFIGALEAKNQKTSGWLPELAHALEVEAYWLKTGKGPIRRDVQQAAEEQRATYQYDSQSAELAALINCIPEAERQAMIAMLRTRFGTKAIRQRRDSSKNDALSGFADVTEKPNNIEQQKQK